MKVKKKARRVVSGLLTAVTVLSTILSPVASYASDDTGTQKKVPYYKEIKDQLDEDEVVKANDYELHVGDLSCKSADRRKSPVALAISGSNQTKCSNPYRILSFDFHSTNAGRRKSQ